MRNESNLSRILQSTLGLDRVLPGSLSLFEVSEQRYCLHLVCVCVWGGSGLNQTSPQ